MMIYVGLSIYGLQNSPNTHVTFSNTVFIFHIKSTSIFRSASWFLFNYLNHLILVRVHLAFLAFVELGSPQAVLSPSALLRFY